MGDLPDKIGKYEIIALLGEGAMGAVYEGFDPHIERRVAIKILHSHLVNEKNGAEFLERFKREAQSAARCTHPNIVSVLDYDQNGDMPFIVMEYVEGASLHEIINKKQGVALKTTLLIISQLLRALHTAHQLDIVHRDIKAANVMISKEDGSVKLADFGIARIAQSAELTMTGAIVGTPKYMAPEQMFGLKVDARADLFSVTMVFLDLLALLPKSSSIPRSSLPEITNLPPNNRIDFSILYPTALIPVLLKGLAVKQAERYQSAREFIKGIKDVLPKVKAASASGPISDEATAMVQKSTQANPTDPSELDSMTNLLVDYLGPIAKNLMVSHDSANTPANELASMVAQEIPRPEEREEFLKRWETISGTRIGTTRIGQSAKADVTQARSFDDDLLKKVGEDYAGYIGPLAARLVRHHASTTRSLEQLIESLANEIPDARDGEKFKNHWLQN